MASMHDQGIRIVNSSAEMKGGVGRSDAEVLLRQELMRIAKDVYRGDKDGDYSNWYVQLR